MDDQVVGGCRPVCGRLLVVTWVIGMVAAVAAVALAGFDLAASAPRGEGGDGAWELLSTPALDGDVTLTGVTALAEDDAWAVGNVYDGITRRTLTLHWDGVAWTRVASPNRTDESWLVAVEGSGPTDVWAVGYERTDDNGYRTLTMRWEGTSWRLVPSPDPGGEGSLLNDVAVASPTEAWAVGTNTVEFPLLGETLVLHWDGERWHRVPSPNPSTIGVGSNLHSVDVSAGGDAWAAGAIDQGDFVQGTMVIRWDGAAWSSVPVPNDASGSLAGEISAPSPGQVWTVGWAGDPTAALAMQRRGGRWITRPLPTGPGAALAAVTTQRGRTWVVGSDGTAALAARWDGRTWTVTQAVDPGAVANSFLDVAAIPRTGCLWAVGQSTDGDLGRALVERYCPG